MIEVLLVLVVFYLLYQLVKFLLCILGALLIGGGVLLLLVVLSPIAIGVAWGMVVAVANLSKAVKARLGKRSGRVEEHAFVGYFHYRGDWLENFVSICADTKRMTLARMPLPIRVPDEAWTTFLNFMKVTTLVLATTLSLPMIFAVMGMVFGACWGVHAGVSCCIRGCSSVVDWIYGRYHLCRTCHRRTAIPVFLCPACGAEHAHLVPTAKYGAFSRKCECGTRLPTMRWLGRGRLQAVCPGCKRPMENEKYAPVCVAFVGGASVGKSQLMMDSVVAIQERVGAKLGKKVRVPAVDAGKAGALLRDYQGGVRPGITRDAAIEAVCLELKGRWRLFPQRVYLYDPPGESFRSAGKVLRHKYYEHLRAVVFVADPSAMPEVMGAYEDKGVAFGIPQKGAQPPEESFQRWLIAMEREYPGLVKETICALVVGKADEGAMKAVTGLGAGEGEAACRTFLAKYGAGNLLAALESNFREVRAFSVGAVGTGGDGKAFSPVGLDGMLEWVLTTA